ncbi:HAD family hydrolase [Bosea psychrotolerans]|uniref:HAD superfamily hydrolase (TIGR01509 family) n=1 Tax=Bosea psychrotolerans TaxID=1871628 RepID=A0A2S4MPW2_9HYPH|nr:HAD family phosphatase [Bosea psychrotolerans]POR56783.1 HAD superfamily hydrolase (TIGR01509 family) [Bosea psychrotolerans]
MTNNGPVGALIFDMDGTIVDNMRFHEDAWEHLHVTHGLPFDRDSFFSHTAGMAVGEIISPLFPNATPAEIEAMGREKELFYRRNYGPHVAPMPGLLELMARADAAGVPMAVATAAPPGNIDIVLDTLGLRLRFATIIAPSQGFRGKPNPDLFLGAAERMTVAPEACIVFEDAPNGVEAARRAGMRAVAILSMLGARDFDSFDNVIASAKDFAALDGLPALRFA